MHHHRHYLFVAKVVTVAMMALEVVVVASYRAVVEQFGLKRDDEFYDALVATSCCQAYCCALPF